MISRIFADTVSLKPYNKPKNLTKKNSQFKWMERNRQSARAGIGLPINHGLLLGGVRLLGVPLASFAADKLLVEEDAIVWWGCWFSAKTILNENKFVNFDSAKQMSLYLLYSIVEQMIEGCRFGLINIGELTVPGGPFSGGFGVVECFCDGCPLYCALLSFNTTSKHKDLNIDQQWGQLFCCSDPDPETHFSDRFVLLT